MGQRPKCKSQNYKVCRRKHMNKSLWLWIIQWFFLAMRWKAQAKKWKSD